MKLDVLAVPLIDQLHQIVHVLMVILKLSVGFAIYAILNVKHAQKVHRIA